MNPTDEMLGAYVDGELDAAARAAVAQAIAADPTLAARVATLETLNRELRGAFGRVLNEPAPARLSDALEHPAAAVVVDLASARATKVATRAPRRRVIEWSAIAASVVVGVLVGHFGLQTSPAGLLAVDDRGVAAGPALASMLSKQLASDPASTGGIAVGLSFREKGGAYCRTFTVSARDELSGVACRGGDQWRVGALSIDRKAPDATGGYRQAASALPPVIREAVAARIDGEPFDTTEEALARQRGWH